MYVRTGTWVWRTSVVHWLYCGELKGVEMAVPNGDIEFTDDGGDAMFTMVLTLVIHFGTIMSYLLPNVLCRLCCSSKAGLYSQIPNQTSKQGLCGNLRWLNFHPASSEINTHQPGKEIAHENRPSSSLIKSKGSHLSQSSFTAGGFDPSDLLVPEIMINADIGCAWSGGTAVC